MTPLEAATASGDAVNGLGTHFMLDMATYVYGETLGFQGMDFYVGGRGGALGDVTGDVVAAAFVFFEPGFVNEAWARTAGVKPRLEAAAEFAGVAHRWAGEKVPDDFPAARLAELAKEVADAASPATAPLFAAWRGLDEPSPDRPKALAIHRINGLRELRGALHGDAILAQGITPHEAVARRTPYMLGAFGWKEPHPDRDPVKAPWAEAQAATERAVAPAFEPLPEADREEFVTLVNALQAAVTD
jgi:hypothetical protein